jgi:hypothetical protein
MHEPRSSRNIYQTAAERELHEQAMASLADELHREIVDVQPVYERTYVALSGQARIRDYLPLLVTRRTRYALLRN